VENPIERGKSYIGIINKGGKSKESKGVE